MHLITGQLGRLAARGAAASAIACALAIGWMRIDVAEWIAKVRNRVTAPQSTPIVQQRSRPLLASSGLPSEPPHPSSSQPVEQVPAIHRVAVADRNVRAIVGTEPPAGSLSFPTVTAAATMPNLAQAQTESSEGPTFFSSLSQLAPSAADPIVPPQTLPSMTPTPAPQVTAPPLPPVVPLLGPQMPPPVMPLEQLPSPPPPSPPNLPSLGPTMLEPSTLGPTTLESKTAINIPPTVQLGRFLAHGTITPADVRNMALRNNKEIAVLGLVTPRNETFVDTEASVFDPVFNVAMLGGAYNRQVATQVQALGPPIPELRTSFWQPVAGLNQIYLEKLFVTGGKAQVGIGQNYTSYSPAGSFVFVNPAYYSSLNLQLDQPLFRGRGPAATTAMLQIARANQEQSWQAFMATVSQILRDADFAYWDLYAAFQDWEVRDMAASQALETLERERGKLQLGEGSVPDVAQAEEQYEAFLISRTDAENRLVGAQRVLRRLMGIPPDDQRPLVPAVGPSDARIELDWNYATEEAHGRPEFAAQKAAVAAAEAELARRRNGLLPDLSMRAIYSVTGLNNDLDQAWSTVGTGNYNDWTAGVIYRQPIGRRSDRSLLARAEVTLALEAARLRQLEHEILHQLNAAFQNVQNTQRLLDLHRRRREAAATQLTARRELYHENRAALLDQLNAELRYASALFDESTARIMYQRALTEWNYARGALAEAGIAAR